MNRRASINLVQSQVTQRHRFCLHLGRQQTPSLATRCSANFKNVCVISVELKRKGQIYERQPIVREAQLLVADCGTQQQWSLPVEANGHAIEVTGFGVK